MRATPPTLCGATTATLLPPPQQQKYEHTQSKDNNSEQQNKQPIHSFIKFIQLFYVSSLLILSLATNQQSPTTVRSLSVRSLYVCLFATTTVHKRKNTNTNTSCDSLARLTLFLLRCACDYIYSSLEFLHWLYSHFHPSSQSHSETLILLFSFANYMRMTNIIFVVPDGHFYIYLFYYINKDLSRLARPHTTHKQTFLLTEHHSHIFQQKAILNCFLFSSIFS